MCESVNMDYFLVAMLTLLRVNCFKHYLKFYFESLLLLLGHKLKVRKLERYANYSCCLVNF